jgi:NADPH:quinone reductase-like Zn-dependent oxidoreductase
VEEVVARTTRARAGADRGALRLPIDKIYRIEEAAEAFERMERNRHFGKIVLVGM